MIEMLGVLAIIGVLSAGGIMGYTTAMENYRVNKYLNDMANLVAFTQNLFLGKSFKHTNFNTQKLCQIKALSGDYCKTTPLSPFGTQTTMMIAQSTSTSYYHQTPWSGKKTLVLARTDTGNKSTCVKVLSSPVHKNIAPIGSFLIRGSGYNTAIELPVSIDITKTLCETSTIIEIWLGVEGSRTDGK